jgi:hypothetical protein
MVALYDASSAALVNCQSTNFFPYRGGEGYHAAVNDGSFLYAAGSGETCGFGNYNFVLSKFDLFGSLLAKVTDPGVDFGGYTCIRHSNAGALALLNGNLYVAGFSDLSTEDGVDRPVLMRYTTALTRDWRVRPIDNSGGAFNGVTALDNYIYAVGYAGVYPNYDYLIEKYDEAGNRIWSRTSSGAGTDMLNAVIAVGGRLFAVGSTSSQGAGGLDAVLLQIDPATGDTLYTTTYGGAQDDIANAVATDGTDLYVVGGSRSFASAEGNIVGQSDIMLLRYSINAITPVVNLSSTNLSFGTQNVGTMSTSQSVTLTNAGIATLNLSSISAGGDFALTVTGTSCPYGGGTVATGTNCTIDVTFTPTATGARTGTVTITDNASGSPQLVNLSGTGVAPAAFLSVATLTFANQVTNTTSAAQSVTLTNTGSGVLSISSIALTGSNPGDFAISANTCGPTVAPGANCSIGITFTPLASSARAANLTFADNASTSPQSVTLTGKGLDPFAVSPATLAFGNEGAGTTSAAKNVTLRNNTSAPVSITGTSITGPNGTEFAQAATTCGPSLAAHAACTVSITFSPVVTGAESATLTITDSAANSPQSVGFSGTGVQPVTLSTTTLNFGNQGIFSASDPKNVTLKNNNSVALNFTGMTITGTNSADYAQSATTCGSTLAGHSTCIISLTFTPSGAGTETAVLNITDDAGNNPQTVSMTGIGVQQVTLSASTLSFGNQVINATSEAKNVTMKNNTSADLTITGTAIAGPNATEFSQAGTTCGPILSGHATCILSVAFSPVTTSAESAMLTITDSANNSPQTIALSGTGIVPISLTPATLTFGTLKVGNPSAAKTVTIKNNQSITLNISGIAITGVNAGDFSQPATTCGPTLAPNASCSVSIAFTPMVVGARSASLNVSDDASTSPQSMSLSGTGK